MPLYPDKPTRSTPSVLAGLKDGDWLAQFKHDGWRALIEWDGAKVSVLTRRRRPIKVGPGLAAELRRLLASTPADTVLDGEWLGMRRTEKAEGDEDDGRHWRRVREGEHEELVLFDVLQVGGQWAGGVAALERFRLLTEFWRASGGARKFRHLRLVRSTTRRYRQFFEATADEPLCEGIVLKRVGSTVIAARNRSVDNAAWLKVKHGGE